MEKSSARHSSEPGLGARPKDDPIELALSQVGDRWTFMILREAFFGVRRFDEMLRNTKASPSILTGRLKRMVADGLLDRHPYCERPPRYEYVLTAKGKALYPAIVLLMKWSDDWVAQNAEPTISLIHTVCGHELHPVLKCDKCGKPIAAEDIDWRVG
ncbi:winged helix-turn-helix transcriptional regulator [Erythrobacter rubeus]|uniref:Helix-turn-helix transcriptional regulator n=1 Tax=Erythrobacter rubeus TaxID=2760803 RepID=A0ABR8KRZ9_9SPHN|nr:helix-turn-helix domain-containing protein [Erythrobacter rubeus]MBD2840941.1 helix-turn-helix transcriptional regulator [Erythrobacter rubeus]